MENNWHYAENQQSKGPVSRDQLRALLDSGQLPKSTLVWQPGMANWRPASDILELWLETTVENAAPPAEDEPEIINLRPLPEYEAPGQTQEPEPLPVSTCRAPYVADCDYASIWRRFWAMLLDGIIIMLIGVPISLLSIFLNGIIQLSLTDLVAVSEETFLYASVMALCTVFVNFVIMLAIQFFYSGFFLSRYAATPGKMALGIRVVRSDGSQVSFLRGGCRVLATQLSAWLFYIGYLMALFDDKKRTLHDHLCDTVVVQ